MGPGRGVWGESLGFMGRSQFRAWVTGNQWSLVQGRWPGARVVESLKLEQLTSPRARIVAVLSSDKRLGALRMQAQCLQAAPFVPGTGDPRQGEKCQIRLLPTEPPVPIQSAPTVPPPHSQPLQFGQDDTIYTRRDM